MDTRICKDCKFEKPISDYHKKEKWYNRRCKKCHNKKYQPATGKPNKGRFKKNHIPKQPFKKDHVPWNKGMAGRHFRIEGVSNYRKRAFAIYDQKCAGCYSENNLDAHHIDGNRENNEIDNIHLLCKICHHRVHSLYEYGFTYSQTLIILRKVEKWIKVDQWKNKD